MEPNFSLLQGIHKKQWQDAIKSILSYRALLLASLLLVLLAGCIPGDTPAFSAEQAVIQGATRTMGSSARNPVVIDANSIQVRQKQAVQGKTFVMVSFSRQIEGRQEDCLMLYEARRNALGTWSSGSGGGGCSGQIGGGPSEPPQPLETGSGSSGSSEPQDPGFCYVYGLVHQEGIVKVRVTWNDGQAQDAGVVNGSYLTIRAGSFAMNKVEGLGANDEVLYSFAPEFAPGKE